MSIYAIPAQAAGFVSLMGRIEKGLGDTLNLPEGLINIGGNGQGYVLESKTNWDPVDSANNDGTITELSVGDDVYVYAVQDDSGVAKMLASYNSTYPDGHDDTSSRKTGGFHYGRVRGLADAYDDTAGTTEQIIPNSIWDLQHRPKCDPTGMIEVVPDQVWVDIYLASTDGANWPETKTLSEYDAIPLSGDDGYAYYDYRRLVRNAGKRLVTMDEALAMAYGVPQGATNAGARINTGQHTDYGFDCVSCLGADQPSGNLRQLLKDNLFDRDTTHAWADEQNVGKDESENHGQIRHADARCAIFGGHWDSTDEAGARCLDLGNAPWGVNSPTGLRAACDAL